MNIIVGENAEPVEENAAELLRQRVSETGVNTAAVFREGHAPEKHDDSLTVLLGRPDSHRKIHTYLEQRNITLPNDFDPGAEGFLLMRSPDLGNGVVVAAGVDNRGVVYVVGEILRQMDFEDFGLTFPSKLSIRTAPAFEIRGTQFDQGGKMVKLTGVRLALVRPRYQERYAMRMNQKSQSIYADDIPLAIDLELPEYESEFVEFDIPRETTSDGKLRIRFEKHPDVPEGDWIDTQIWRNCGGWGTLVSEIWLMKCPQ